MRINIQKRSRALETISEGDILVFNNREEVVKIADNLTGNLYTERIVGTADKQNPLKKEFVGYEHIQRVFPTSSGRVYNWVKWRAA